LSPDLPGNIDHKDHSERIIPQRHGDAEKRKEIFPYFFMLPVSDFIPTSFFLRATAPLRETCLFISLRKRIFPPRHRGLEG
jgi:hypothetical protein